MIDHVSKAKRSAIMKAVGTENTGPEMTVRKALHRLGYRFRLHRKDLPGSPDIVLPKYKTVIFVHGCFWHRHKGCKKATTPKTNTEYWQAKFRQNVDRDKRNKRALEALGWRVVVVWQCEVPTVEKAMDTLIAKLGC